MQDSVTFGKRRNMKDNDLSSTPDLGSHPVLEHGGKIYTSFTPDRLESHRRSGSKTPDLPDEDDGHIHVSNPSTSPSFRSEKMMKHRSEFNRRNGFDVSAQRKSNFLASKQHSKNQLSSSPSQLSHSGNQSPTFGNSTNNGNGSSTSLSTSNGNENDSGKMSQWRKSKAPNAFSFQSFGSHSSSQKYETLSDCPTMEKKLEFLNTAVGKLEKRARELRTIALRQQVIIDGLKKKLGLESEKKDEN